MPRGSRWGSGLGRNQEKVPDPVHATGHMAYREERAEIFSKTKMCKFHLLGMCSRGSSCKFAHHKAELNPLPDLSRTKICKTLLNRGACEDPVCRYAHNVREIRALPEAIMGNGIAEPRVRSRGDLGNPQTPEAASEPMQQLCWAFPAPWPQEQVEQASAVHQNQQAEVGQRGGGVRTPPMRMVFLAPTAGLAFRDVSGQPQSTCVAVPGNGPPGQAVEQVLTRRKVNFSEDTEHFRGSSRFSSGSLRTLNELEEDEAAAPPTSAERTPSNMPYAQGPHMRDVLGVPSHSWPGSHYDSDNPHTVSLPTLLGSGVVVKNTFLEFHEDVTTPPAKTLRPVRTASGRLDLMS